jgi:membrane-bound lytic murein transglycosylase B
MLRHLSWLLAACLALPVQAEGDFAAWLQGLRQEAAARGVSQPVLDAALQDVTPIRRVLELDQHQPEFVDAFLVYLDQRVTPAQVRQGRRLLQAHRPLLDSVSARYGVPPSLLVAFWGMETRFGAYQGNQPIPAALATLAFDTRRAGFFRSELLQALDIIEAGNISAQDMKGSWAGAMGQIQFMPSTFQGYAVDADGDGRKDIWHSLPDAFASAAHYLQAIGWQAGEVWGREVLLPDGFDLGQARPELARSVDAWRQQGVRRADGRPLPRSELFGSILLPQGHSGPAFLVYRNFDVIMKWNRSVNYALAVAHLADRLLGLPPLRKLPAADNRRLSRSEAFWLQRQLALLGLNPGEIDGVLGARTRAALREFQQQVGLPADGYPSQAVIDRLQTRTEKLSPIQTASQTLKP